MGNSSTHCIKCGQNYEAENFSKNHFYRLHCRNHSIVNGCCIDCDKYYNINTSSCYHKWHRNYLCWF